MHIAVCFWGLLRSLRYTFSSIRHYVLTPLSLSGHTYEIFIHTYKFNGTYTNLRNHESNTTLNFSEWQILKPNYLQIDDQDLFDQKLFIDKYKTHGDPWHNNYVSYLNHLRALYSLYSVSLLVEKQIQLRSIDNRTNKSIFDYIIYLRPDVTYLNDIPIYLADHFPKALFLPDFHRSCRGGQYNDRMAMGNIKSGLIYGKRFEEALNYSKFQPLHSESFTYNILQKHNVGIIEIPFRFRRTRANGEFHIRDKTAIMAPKNQPSSQTYHTFFLLRWLYYILEWLSSYKVYIWNHDDDENLYCTPHMKLSSIQCRQFKYITKYKKYHSFS